VAANAVPEVGAADAAAPPAFPTVPPRLAPATPGPVLSGRPGWQPLEESEPFD